MRSVRTRQFGGYHMVKNDIYGLRPGLGDGKTPEAPRDEPPNTSILASTDTRAKLSGVGKRWDIGSGWADHLCAGLSKQGEHLWKHCIRRDSVCVNANTIVALSRKARIASPIGKFSQIPPASAYCGAKSMGPLRKRHIELDSRKCSLRPRACWGYEHPYRGRGHGLVIGHRRHAHQPPWNRAN